MNTRINSVERNEENPAHTHVFLLLFETVSFDQSIVEDDALGFEESVEVRVGVRRTSRA